LDDAVSHYKQTPSVGERLLSTRIACHWTIILKAISLYFRYEGFTLRAVSISDISRQSPVACCYSYFDANPAWGSLRCHGESHRRLSRKPTEIVSQVAVARLLVCSLAFQMFLVRILWSAVPSLQRTAIGEWVQVNTLKMEAIYSSETLVTTYMVTRRNIPQGSCLHIRRRKNLKSHRHWHCSHSQVRPAAMLVENE
jgi:hypothetical protein